MIIAKTATSVDCNLVDGIFLDFSAAFDRVDHSVLLHKLHNYGIRCNMLGWIQSFLSDRKQMVVFQGCYSNWVSVSSGVCQGSVLGPILFLLFVNDINDSLSSLLFQFADDHSIVRCIRSFQDHQALQNYLDKIHLWTLKNNLPPNASKCAVINFSRSSGHSLYNLGGFEIKVVNDFKLLGVVFNSSLSFSSYVDSVCKKVSRLTGFCIRISWYMNFSALLHLLKALILPHLTYCAVVWNLCQIGLFNRLDIGPYESRLVVFGLLKLCDLFNFLCLVFCFKLINGNPPKSMNLAIFTSLLVQMLFTILF